MDTTAPTATLTVTDTPPITDDGLDELLADNGPWDVRWDRVVAYVAPYPGRLITIVTGEGKWRVEQWTLDVGTISWVSGMRHTFSSKVHVRHVLDVVVEAARDLTPAA